MARSVRTAAGGLQSAIIVPVAEAEAIVGPVRSTCDPMAVAGVPAHITLMVPWLPGDRIGPADLDALHQALDGTPAFDFMLSRVGWFGRDVLWLAPEPAEPFIELTGRLAARFGSRPYGGEYDKVVPHLTIGHAGGGVDLEAVASAVAPLLPIPCRASEMWAMVGDGVTWKGIDRISFV